jgi:hypothetical protein
MITDYKGVFSVTVHPSEKKKSFHERNFSIENLQLFHQVQLRLLACDSSNHHKQSVSVNFARALQIRSVFVQNFSSVEKIGDPTDRRTV